MSRDTVDRSACHRQPARPPVIAAVVDETTGGGGMDREELLATVILSGSGFVLLLWAWLIM